MRLRLTLLVLTAITATTAVAQQFHIVRAAAIAWGPAPDTLPKGAQFALISGDPVKPGPFAFRLKMPPGYTVLPHTHPAAEAITVISGRLYHGMGKTFDRAAGQAVAQGDFVYLPPEMPHAVWTTNAPAIIQVNGTGPFTIRYIRPQDDPRHPRRR